MPKKEAFPEKLRPLAEILMRAGYTEEDAMDRVIAQQERLKKFPPPMDVLIED